MGNAPTSSPSQGDALLLSYYQHIFWRIEQDLNLRGNYSPDSFQDYFHKPLGHLSRLIVNGVEPFALCTASNRRLPIIYLVRATGREPVRLSPRHFKCRAATVTPYTRLVRKERLELSTPKGMASKTTV